MNRSFKIGSNSRRSPAVVIILCIAAALLVALDQAGMLGDLHAQASSLIAPALTVVHQAGTTIGDTVGRATTPSQTETELQALREENSRLKAENLQVQQLQLEIDRLHQQLNIQQSNPWKLAGANISAFTPDIGRQVLLIDIGSADGVKSGMAVIARDGSSPTALIGIIQDVGPHSASVLLITDFSSSVTGRIYRSDHAINGIVQGQWQVGSRLRLEEIAHDETIATGDIVVTAGLSAMFSTELPRASIPANIPIGTIEQVNVTGHDQYADLRPFIDPDRVRYAWVILQGGG